MHRIRTGTGGSEQTLSSRVHTEIAEAQLTDWTTCRDDQSRPTRSSQCLAAAPTTRHPRCQRHEHEQRARGRRPARAVRARDDAPAAAVVDGVASCEPSSDRAMTRNFAPAVLAMLREVASKTSNVAGPAERRV